jgi:hypothetical protein
MRNNHERLLRKVWNADATKRYQPMAYGTGSGWGVYDVLMGKFVDDKLDEIDVDEPLVKN